MPLMIDRSGTGRELAAVWRLAWPIIISNVTVPLLGLVDTAVVGHLPVPRYLAAVTLGATLFSFLFWGFGFLRMGTTGLTSQAWGRGDHQAVRNLLGQSLVLAAVIGGLLLLFSYPLIDIGLWLLNARSVTRTLAFSYSQIRILAAPAVLANYAILGWFLGQQNSRITLYLMVITNSVNVVLDVVLVMGLGMAANGVAWGTVIADYAALAIGLYLVWRQLGRLDGAFAIEPLRRVRAYSELFRVNRHLFVRTLCLLFAFAFFTAQGARFGDVVLSANAVLMQCVMLTSYALDGFATAAEALSGRAVGRGDWSLFGASVRAAGTFSLITAVLAMIVFAVGGHVLIALLTNLPGVRAVAGEYLPWLIAMPAIAVWSYLLDGVFIGATASREMRDTVLLSVAVYLPLWYLCRGLGNTGLWLAFSGFMLVRSVSLSSVYWHYRRRRWRD